MVYIIHHMRCYLPWLSIAASETLIPIIFAGPLLHQYQRFIKLLCLPKVDCRKQGFEQCLAQREVWGNHALHIFDAILAVLRVGKVWLISNAPPVIVLHLTAIDDKPELRLDHQVSNHTRSP